jgi:hypothetical protein
MKLRNKIILKGLFHSVLQLLILLLFGWFNDRLFEMIIYYVCFFIFKNDFLKKLKFYDAYTNWDCTFITMIVDYLVSIFIPDKSISILITIIFTYFVIYASYLYREHLDNKDLQNLKANNTPTKKKSKRQIIIDILGKENLDEESIEKFCISKGLVNISETIYLYLNNKLEETADILEIDTSTLTRRINKFIKVCKD